MILLTLNVKIQEELRRPFRLSAALLKVTEITSEEPYFGFTNVSDLISQVIGGKPQPPTDKGGQEMC